MPLNKTDIFILVPSIFLKAGDELKEVAHVSCLIKDGQRFNISLALQ